jgi:hypothetical protein
MARSLDIGEDDRLGFNYEALRYTSLTSAIRFVNRP